MVGLPEEFHPAPLSVPCNGEKIVKIWFCLLLCILMLMIGCASYEKKPVYHEEGSDYWKGILYHQYSEPEKR